VESFVVGRRFPQPEPDIMGSVLAGESSLQVNDSSWGTCSIIAFNRYVSDVDTFKVVPGGTQSNMTVKAEIFGFNIKQMKAGKLIWTTSIAFWASVDFKIGEIRNYNLPSRSGVLRGYVAR
jgi:hypothetical protein